MSPGPRVLDLTWSLFGLWQITFAFMVTALTRLNWGIRASKDILPSLLGPVQMVIPARQPGSSA